MQPHLVRWDRAYRDRGLTIVYAAYGAKVTPERLTEIMATDGAAFPLLYDAASTMNRTYAVRAYPTAYVIGRDGTVVWEGIPHFDPPVVERAIQDALASR
jgi:hypothetical protein